MTLRINGRPIERGFNEIAKQDFAPINVKAACDRLDMYSGMDEVREFDLAMRLKLIQQGAEMHSLLAHQMDAKLNLPPERPLKIVTISSQRALINHSTQDSAPFRAVSRIRCRGLVVNDAAHASRAYRPDEWIAANEAALQGAIAAEADIVCFGEFDYPSCAYEDATKRREAEELQRRHDAAIETLIGQAQRPMLVFAGSYHKWSGDDCTNVGVVFRRERDRRGHLETRQDLIEKRTSAKSLGEVIAAAPTPQLNFFATSMARIGVLICIDAFDPGIATSIFANSYETNPDRLQYILVPSYNRSSKLLQSCQMLSYYGNCVVVYVNALKDARHADTEVYVSGVPLRTWKSQLDGFRELITSKKRFDQRIFAAVPGLRQAEIIAQLADVAQHLDVAEASPGPFVIRTWSIPPEFVTKAAQTMAPKFPYNRARLISSLSALAPPNSSRT